MPLEVDTPVVGVFVKPWSTWYRHCFELDFECVCDDSSEFFVSYIATGFGAKLSQAEKQFLSREAMHIRLIRQASRNHIGQLTAI
jgi:hypothetical protein